MNENARTTAATYFYFDHPNHQIKGSEQNFKKAGNPTTAQYEALMAAMALQPTYTFAPVAPKVKKQTYAGLNFDLIDEYVNTIGNDTVKEEFWEIVNRGEGFQPLKSWFLDYYKADFSVEKAKQEIKAAKLKRAQEQLKAKKADVRKVVKARKVAAPATVVELPTAQNF